MPLNSPHQALLIFAKNPCLGHVKTRLARELGDETALAVYRHLLRLTREATYFLPCRIALFYSDFVDKTDDWDEQRFEKRVQSGSDLGERMSNAFREIFADGSVSQAVIIGTDCPDLSPALLAKAFFALETHDFVLGPALDGGYYLLGMKALEESVFQKKTWSTDTVLRDTRDDLQALGKSFFLLPTLRDVDTPADLPAELLGQITGHER